MQRKMVAVVVCLLLLAGAVYAQEQAAVPEKSKTMMGDERMGHMKDKSMCKMRGMGCPMMAREIVATSDGGVIVLAGNKLYKYDKDLNLKKEVEVKIDKAMLEKCRTMCGLKDEKPQGEVGSGMEEN